ncbi:MAG: PAS domain S-box protein [Proteobacteria bacterium]|nr:PAS domain S-box protein [Desulfobulbaceae bacterium]MBU4152601.1 PAS domain S-box protein [Pseudomonadota bacterium]
MSQQTTNTELKIRLQTLEGQLAALQQENSELHQTEERFRALFEQTADYILILELGDDGIPVIVDLNEAACMVHGYRRAELLGQPISILDSPETRHNIPDRTRRVMSGQAETFEAVHTRKDGTLITVEVTAQLILVSGKQYIYAIERDITARKQTEKVLRDYERIIATSREHMSLVDRQYIYRAVNDTYLLAHQHRREDIVGRSVVEMLGQETFELLVKDKLDRCLTGEEVRYQGWFQFAGLGRLFMDVAYYPVVEADGAVSGVVVNARDLTAQHEVEEELRQAKEKLETRVAERTAELLRVNARLQEEILGHRRSEQRLRESEANYRAIVEDQTELICRFRPDWILTFVNEAYCRYFGQSKEALVGHSFMSLLPEEGDRRQTEEHLSSLGRDRPSADIEHRVVLPDGSIRWQHWIDRAILDQHGKLIEFQAVGRDTTERRLLEDDLRQARNAAEAASQAKSTFLANMSHEVRTPLNAIIGFAEIMQDGMIGPVNREQQDYLEEIRQSGHRLLGLITDILDLSLLEAARTEVEHEFFDLALLLDSWLEFFREMAKQRDIVLQMQVDTSVGMINSDARILTKVMERLVENAVKFTASGGTVGINAGKEEEMIRITVWDTGIGISKEQQERLFLPFQQGDSSVSKSYQGLGLGLVLCKRFLDLLGGRIEVDSTVGEGSRFSLFVPVTAKSNQ